VVVLEALDTCRTAATGVIDRVEVMVTVEVFGAGSKVFVIVGPATVTTDVQVEILTPIAAFVSISILQSIHMLNFGNDIQIALTQLAREEAATVAQEGCGGAQDNEDNALTKLQLVTRHNGTIFAKNIMKLVQLFLLNCVCLMM